MTEPDEVFDLYEAKHPGLKESVEVVLMSES